MAALTGSDDKRILKRSQSTLFVSSTRRATGFGASIKRLLFDSKTKSKSAPSIAPETFEEKPRILTASSLRNSLASDTTELSPVTPTSRDDALLLAEAIFKDVSERLLRKSPSEAVSSNPPLIQNENDPSNSLILTNTTHNNTKEKIKDAEMNRLHHLMLDTFASNSSNSETTETTTNNQIAGGNCFIE